MTRNEARNIEACLDHLADIADVVVVDSHSDDGTPDLATAAGVRVVPFTWDGRFPKKKEWSLRNADLKHDWVLFVDADELVPPTLLDEIEAFVVSPRTLAAMGVHLTPFWQGRELRHGYRPQKVILVDSTRCRYPEFDESAAPNMWEVEGHYQPIVDGDVGLFDNSILHDDADDLYAYFARHNRYSDWEAAIAPSDFKEEAATSGFRKTLKRLFYAAPARGLISFLDSYVFRLGFLDGSAGFDYATARCFYYWQIAAKRRSLPTQDTASPQ